MKKLLAQFSFEAKQWFILFTKYVPGKLGCHIRNLTWGYKTGKFSTIWDGTHINHPEKLKIGSNVSINRGCTIHAGGEIDIGDNVLIGPKVVIYSQNHKFRSLSKNIAEQGYSYKKVTIEDDVWIASGAIILPGSHISKGAIIGAGAVVRGSIPTLAIVTGNPGTITGTRTQMD
ncbi:acyltransferase [Pseudomonas laurylsulfatiphila]|uniref:acyltransferase n=1 Tax=Pseudomonas laurylsulfatiphila TaxID=2011015 RepID=UPI003D1E570D